MRLIAINSGDDAALTPFATTQHLLRSWEFDHASWSKNGTSVTPGVTPPVGTPAAWVTSVRIDALVEDTSAGVHTLRQNTTTLAAGRYTFSIHLAPGTRTLARISVINAGVSANASNLDIDLSTGVCTLSNSGTGITGVSYVAGSNQGGGWRRYAITVDTSTALDLQPRVSMRNAGGAASYTGNGTSLIYMWRSQFEPGPIASDPMRSFDATINNSGFVGTLPADNVQREGRALVARTSGLIGAQGFVGTWSAARTVGAAVLYRHTLTAGRARLVLFSGAAMTGNIVYDSGDWESVPSDLWSDYTWPDAQQAPKFTSLWLPAPVSAMSFLLMVRDPFNVAGYWQAKRLMLGEVIEPGANLELGLTLTWRDDSRQQRAQSGSLRSDPQAVYRELKGRVLLTDAERNTWQQAVGYAGLKREVFLSVYPGTGGAKERDHALLGKFASSSEVVTDQPLNHRAPVHITET